MKITIIVIVIFLGFLLVNIETLSRFSTNNNGKAKYEQEDYAGASVRFWGAGNLYNVANSYYKLGKYEEALNLYEAEEEKTHEVYHNIGNAYYEQALEERSSVLKRMRLLKKSLNALKKAEILKPHESTIINREIVEEAIKDLEDAIKQADEENQDGEQGESDNSDSQSNEDTEESSEGGQDEENSQSGEDQAEGEDASQQESGSEEGDEDQEGSESESTEESGESGEGEEGAGSEGEEETANSLSEEETKAIENYAEELENSQGEYGEYYNKVYKENQSQFENMFGRDPFFDNSLLDGENQKKDW